MTVKLPKLPYIRRLKTEKKSLSSLMTGRELYQVRRAHGRYTHFLLEKIKYLPVVKKTRFSKSNFRSRLESVLRCWSTTNCWCSNEAYCDICLAAWRSGLLYGLAKRPIKTKIWVWRNYYVLKSYYTPQQLDYLWHIKLLPQMQQGLKELKSIYTPVGMAWRIHTYMGSMGQLTLGVTALLVLDEQSNQQFQSDAEQASLMELGDTTQLPLLASRYWDYQYPIENVPVPPIHFWRSVHPLRFRRYRTKKENRCEYYRLWRYRHLHKLESLFPSSARQMEALDSIIPLDSLDLITQTHFDCHREGCLGKQVTSKIGSIFKKETV